MAEISHGWPGNEFQMWKSVSVEVKIKIKDLSNEKLEKGVSMTMLSV